MLPIYTSTFCIISALLVFLYCTAQALTRPFSLDETDIALRAHLILTEGLFPTGFVSGRAEALTHPPLYDLVISCVFKLFGEAEVVARGFGAMTYLITCALSCLTLRTLSRHLSLWASTIAVTVLAVTLLINPLMLQHALLIDADTTGTAFCVAAFFYVFVRSRNAEGFGYALSRLVLCFITAVMFLFKEMSPFAILAGVSTYHLINRDLKRAVSDLIVILGGGAALAWLSWSLYAQALGMDPARIFTSGHAGSRYSSVMSLEFIKKVFRSLPTIARWPIYWLSAPLIMFVVISFIARAAAMLRTGRARIEDALWAAGLAVWVPFLLFKPSIDMMKYQFPVYPILLIASIYGAALMLDTHRQTVARFLSSSHGRISMVALVSAGAVLLWHYLQLGDYVLLLFHRSDRPEWGSFISKYHAPWALVIAALLTAGWRWRQGRLTLCLWGLLVTALPIQAALDWHQARAAYTTVESWMNYGEKGLMDVVNRLVSSGLQPGTIGCWRKDVQYYLEHRHGIPTLKVIYPDELYRTPDQQIPELDKFLRSGAAEWIVTDRVSLLHIPDKTRLKVSAIISQYYKVTDVFGEFTIYRHRSKVVV